MPKGHKQRHSQRTPPDPSDIHRLQFEEGLHQIERAQRRAHSAHERYDTWYSAYIDIPLSSIYFLLVVALVTFSMTFIYKKDGATTK